MTRKKGERRKNQSAFAKASDACAKACASAKVSATGGQRWRTDKEKPPDESGGTTKNTSLTVLKKNLSY
jgi:hypothetical protein